MKTDHLMPLLSLPAPQVKDMKRKKYPPNYIPCSYPLKEGSQNKASFGFRKILISSPSVSCLKEGRNNTEMLPCPLTPLPIAGNREAVFFQPSRWYVTRRALHPVLGTLTEQHFQRVLQVWQICWEWCVIIITMTTSKGMVVKFLSSSVFAFY